MKKIFFIVVLLLITVVGILTGFNFGNRIDDTKPTQQVLPAKEKSEEIIQGNTQESFQQPVEIRIPRINVQANVESVGLDEKRNMDVPKDADNAAWYNLGFKPGEKGNAVIAGHYDKVDGSPAVFWDLTKLVPGDTVITVDAEGNEKTFEVIKSDKYPYDEFPLQEVFGDSSESMLNLITCEGDWNSAKGTYSHRNVVFTRLVE